MRSPSHAREIELPAKLAALEQMGLEPLRAAWLQVYGSPPPPRLSRDLMARGIAFKLQEAAYGGLRPAARRQLAGMIEGNKTGSRAGRAMTSVSLRAGATLVRTWQGQTHTVQVLADGYEHQGQRYRSLSHIAKAITGAHWSGPRFFGLTSAASSATNEAA
jgi:hypothetical protein